MELTKEQIGYIAGIIDGEGTICLNRVTWSKTGERFYRPALYIANTYLDLILWLKAKLGCGSIYVTTKQTDKWKTVYRLTFSANMIRKILPVIIDSMLVKKSQALIILEFMKICKPGNIHRNLDLYEKFYHTMKDLNFRGVKEKGSEFGGNLTSSAEGNTEPSKMSNRLGVCNDLWASPGRDDRV